jgi:hypothetical protein
VITCLERRAPTVSTDIVRAVVFAEVVQRVVVLAAAVVAVVIALLLTRPDETVATLGLLAIERASAIVAVIGPVVAFLVEHGVFEAVSTERKLAARRAPVTCGVVAVVALFARIDFTIAARFGVALRVAAVARRRVAIIATFAGRLVAVATNVVFAGRQTELVPPVVITVVTLFNTFEDEAVSADVGGAVS